MNAEHTLLLRTFIAAVSAVAFRFGRMNMILIALCRYNSIRPSQIQRGRAAGIVHYIRLYRMHTHTSPKITCDLLLVSQAYCLACRCSVHNQNAMKIDCCYYFPRVH